MHAHTRTVIAIAAILTAAPLANATWMAAGSHEPDTSYDTPDLMWPDAAPIGVARVYFNALTFTSAAGGLLGTGIVNPNVGALETQIETANSEVHRAMLGVWVDCNGDNYVGIAETAAKEYSADLLLDDSICPATSGSANRWTAGAHNYNGWVSEYVPIARDPDNAASSGDFRLYEDDEARVWGDFGRPDEQSRLRSCAISPQPRGTWQSTGGVINYADCRAGTVGIDPIGTMNVAFAAIGDPMGWHFSDNEDARSGPLGQIATFGPEDDAHSAAQIWDCNGGNAFHSGDFFNDTPLGPTIPANLQNTTVNAIDPAPGNTADPSIPGTLNHTNEGLGDCDTSNDFGHDFYDGTCNIFVYCWGEGDFSGVNNNDKRQANWNMRFDTANRGQLPLSLALGAGPTGVPQNGGIGWGGSGWTGTSYWLSKPGFGVLRTDLADPSNPEADFAEAYWLSFYAHVGKATTDRGLALPGGGGAYAAWACGDNENGIHHGFNCDVSLWNRNPDGTPLEPGAELEHHELVAPGQPYVLRDVDCYDGRLGDSGVGTQPAFYGTRPCT